MGRELGQPVISDESFQAAFSNEGGVFGKTCFLKNIAGMWLLQECKRAWNAAGKSISYDELETQAQKSPPFKAFIDPDAQDFQAPANMPDAITQFYGAPDRPRRRIPARSRALFLKAWR